MLSYGGMRFLGGTWRPGYLRVDGGRPLGMHARPRGEVVEALLLPPLIDAHVHTGDTFLRRRFSMMDLGLDAAVGPGGFKQDALAGADDATMVASIASCLREAEAAGVVWAVDFREGGARGIDLLRRGREAAGRGIPGGAGGEGAAGLMAPHPPPCRVGVTALGRPTGGDLEEVLSVADGLGISALRDVGAEKARLWVRAARASGRAVALHASEGEREDIGTVLSLAPDLLVHCVACTDEDLGAIARRGTPVAVCPRSNARFGLDLDVRRMTKAGVTVILGTDNGMVADPSPLAEAAFLVDEHGLTVEEALALAENAKVLIPRFAMPIDPVAGDCTVVEGREPGEALSGRAIATVAAGSLRMYEV